MSAAIPEDEVTLDDLKLWYSLQGQLGKLKSAEALLRSRIFRSKFPEPVEGTNNWPLDDGTGAVLKGKHVINRSVDPGTLEALKKAQQEAWGEEAVAQRKTDEFATGSTSLPNIPMLKLDTLIKWKAELVTSAYRELTAEERMYFDQCLVITPGSAQLEIVIPKRAQK